MANLNQIFDSVEETKNFTPEERAKIMNYTYEALKESGQFDRSQLRDMRTDTYNMVADRSLKNTPADIAMQSWGGGDIFAEGGLPDNSELLRKQAQFNNRETLNDVISAIGNPKSWTGAVKPLYDIAELGAALIKTTLPQSVSALMGDENKGFIGNLESMKDTTIHKKVSEWYGDLVDEDPKLYEKFHAGLVDFMLGGVIGKARAATIEGLDWFNRLRVATAPAISSVVSGQVAYNTIDSVQESLQDSELSPAAKLGALLLVPLGAAIGTDMAFGPTIERLVRGGTVEAALAEKIGAVASKAGINSVDGNSLNSLADILLSNPDISKDLADSIRNALGKEALTPEALAGATKEAALTLTNFQSGLPLTEAEAALLQGLRPEERLPDIVRSSIEKNLEDKKILALPEGQSTILAQNSSKATISKDIIRDVNGSISVSSSYIDEKYPDFYRLLSTTSPDEAAMGTFTANNIFNNMKALVVRSGLGMDEAGWKAQEQTLSEAFHLWDEVREGLRDGAGNSLKELLKSVKNGDKIAESIEDAFPGLKAAFQVGVVQEGAAATADAMTRLITVGADKLQLSDLMHEIGHLHFWNSLDANGKMDWMNTMRLSTGSEASWAESFPGYESAMKRMDSLTPTQQQDALYLLNNPSEMYAQQFSAYAMDNIIPRANTARSFQSAWLGVKKLFNMSYKNWDKLPDDTKAMLVKTLKSPDPIDINAATVDRLMDRVESNRYMTGGAEYDLNKIYTIRQNMELSYGRPLEAIPIEELNVYDLPQAANVQILSFLHGLPEANYEYLKNVMTRMGDELSPANRAALLNRLSSGINIPEVVARDNQSKFLRDIKRRQLAAIEALKGKGDNFTDADINKILKDTTPNIGDSLSAKVQMGLAELDLQHQELTSFVTDVLGSKGLIDVIDPTFLTKMSQAEMLSNLFTQKGSFNLSMPSVFTNSLRILYAGVLGMESTDEGGVEIPGIGRVTWSAERFLSNGWAVPFLVPGVPTAALKAIGKGGEISKLGMAKLRQSASKNQMFDKIEKTVSKQIERAKVAAEYLTGFGEDLNNIKKEAIVKATNDVKDFLILRDAMVARFTPEERDAITKILTKEPSFTNQQGKFLADPDIQLSLTLIKEVYGRIEKMFSDIGLASPKFKDFTNYVNRVYDNVDTTQESAVFRFANIEDIKGNFLRDRGLEGIISNSAKAMQGGADNALDILMESVQQTGKDIKDIVKINSYKDLNGDTVWVVPGTQKEQDFIKAGYTKFLVWDDQAGTTGYKILGQHRNGNLKVIRDYTYKERQHMGENFDIALRLGAMGQQLEHDLRRGSIYHLLSQRADIARVPKNNAERKDLIDTFGWREVPDEIRSSTGLKKYGSLSGMLVDPKVMRLINSMERPAYKYITSKFSVGNPLSEMFKNYSKIMNMWKFGKTVLSPATGFYNFVSNAFMGTMLGHNVGGELWDGYKFAKIHSLFRKYEDSMSSGRLQDAQNFLAKAKADPLYSWYNEMRQKGMIDSTFISSDLRNDKVAERIRKQREEWANRNNPNYKKTQFEKVIDIANGWIDGFKDKAGKVGKWATGVYENEDLIYKMGAYYRARNLKGMNADEAIKYAYGPYFDYSNLSPVAQALKDYHIVPFVSYIYNVIPALGKSIIEHPEMVAAVGLALEGLHYAGIWGAFGGGDLQRKKEALDKVLPDWYTRRGGAGLWRTSFVNPLTSDMNFKDEQGRSKPRLGMFSVKNMMPSGDLFETKGSYELPQLNEGIPTNPLYRLLLQNPIIATTIAANQGKEIYTGRSFTEGSPIRTEANKDRFFSNFMRYGVSQALPNLFFLPGTPSFNNVGQALAGQDILDTWGNKTGLDRYGVPLSLGRAVASSFGLRDSVFYPDSVKGRIKGEKSDVTRAKGVVTSLRKDKSNTSEYVSTRKAEAREGSQLQRQRARDMRAALIYLKQESQKEFGGQALPH